MSIASLRDSIPEFARDARLNLAAVLPQNGVWPEEGLPGLTSKQVLGIGLAVAFALGEARTAEAMEAEARLGLTPEEIEASKGAASVMAMNNVYYRALHLAKDEELAKLPAKLRMNIIGKPGIPRVDFELECLAVSAINGCGSCIQSHVHEARNAGITAAGINSTLRIAAVLAASAQAMTIRTMTAPQ